MPQRCKVLNPGTREFSQVEVFASPQVEVFADPQVEAFSDPKVEAFANPQVEVFADANRLRLEMHRGSQVTQTGLNAFTYRETRAQLQEKQGEV